MVIIKSTKCLKKRKGVDMASIRPILKKTEVLYNMPVIREVKGLRPYYAEFTHLKTGELVGMEEGKYLLLQKDGKLIEKTGKFHSPYEYTAISDAKTGQVELLSEDSDDVFTPSLTLTQDKKGNIVATKKAPFMDVLVQHLPEKAKVDAINAVREYEGKAPLSPTEIYSMYARAVTDAFSRHDLNMVVLNPFKHGPSLHLPKTNF